MTLLQAKKLYLAAGGPAEYQKSEWEQIREEMEAVISAPNDRAAGQTILWWGCWDKKFTATSFARKLRNIWKGKNENI